MGDSRHGRYAVPTLREGGYPGSHQCRRRLLFIRFQRAMVLSRLREAHPEEGLLRGNQHLR